MPGGKLGRDGKAEPAQLEFLSGKIWQHLARIHEFSLVLDTQPGPLKSVLFFLVAKLALYFLLAEKDAPDGFLIISNQSSGCCLILCSLEVNNKARAKGVGLSSM